MRNESNLNKYEALRIKGSVELIAIGVIPVITGLVVSKTLSSTDELSLGREVGSDVRHYTAVWGPRSFDETVWQAVEGIAITEGFLPSSVARFQVEIRSPNDSRPPVSVGFERAALSLLKVGTITPDVFIREHVKFH